MPKIRTKKLKYPVGWELISDKITELNNLMRSAELIDPTGKRKDELLWPIFRISHQRSRYIYDMFYVKKAISRELYEFCLDQEYGDKDLIAKWKKPGYEKLCCTRCIQSKETNFGNTCICRIPKKKKKKSNNNDNNNNTIDNNNNDDNNTSNAELDEDEEKEIECKYCGCKGCASNN